MKATKLEQIQKYFEMGFWIIPIRPGSKEPFFEWKKYQKQRPSEEEIIKWFKKYPDANVGFITGKEQNLVVVDIDKKGGELGSLENLPETVKVGTGREGFHFYFRWPKGHKEDITNKCGVRELTDLRGTGGYIVAPPSIHANGNTYRWIIAPDEIEMADFPVEILEENPHESMKAIEDGVLKGTRNESATRMAGYFISKHSLGEAWKKLKKWNLGNIPPLAEDELRVVFNSISKKEAKGKTGKEKKQLSLLNALLSSGDVIKIFRDQLEEPYVVVKIGGHKENLKCESGRMRSWLVNSYYKKYGEIPAPDNVKRVISLLVAQATFGDNGYELSNRVAIRNGTIFYDLTNMKWQSVRIDENDWEVTRNFPILFKRSFVQNEQIIPKKGGNAHTLLDFVNIGKKENNKMLFLISTIAHFVPNIGRPAFILKGAQGSAKSTLSRMIKNLIDPAKIELITLNNNIEELAQQLDQHFFLSFDNISTLNINTSDALCRAITGGGFSKRKLYTDADNVIFTFKRGIILNGINMVANRPDLLDRSILFDLKRIESKDRKSEDKILKEFENKKPLILGGIFTTLSKALKILPTIELSKTPRMADFARWGCAIAESLGYKKERFLKAYEANLGVQNEIIIEEDPVASTISEFASQLGKCWQGTTSELLEALKHVAGKENIDLKCFPKTPSTLSRQINELRISLQEGGIQVEKVSQRDWQICRKRRKAV